jgi:phosphatidylglycerophosphate synthase
MAAPKLPAFESLLKSREVEDPVNLWLHRPLAYGFVALVYRSPITPNQITLLAMLVGIAAAVCFIEGSGAAMLWGGALLWTSAILDGADGILARAQRKFSELGRALDGTADVVVAALTVAAAAYHLWVTKHDPVLIFQVLVTTGATVLHVYLYDFYKESYLQMTNPDWDGKPERVEEVQQRLTRVKRDRAGFAAVVASKLYVDLTRAQTRIVAFTDPPGSREALRFHPSPEAAAIYRRHNRLPIQLWALVSLAPHSYLMSIFAMLDRLDLYVLGRLALGNALFVVVLLWQRRASRETRAELERIGQGPVPVGEASHALEQQ